MATNARISYLLISLSLLSACSNPSSDAKVVTPAPEGSDQGADASASPPASSVALADYAAPTAVAGGNCALDKVNGAAAPMTTVPSDSQVSMSGWVASAQNASPQDALLVLTSATHSFSGPLPTGIERPDVAAALSSESARLAGFNVAVSMAGVAPGEYVLTVVQGGASPQTCSLGKSLSVSTGA